MSKEHRTHAASERANDLWCYQCFTMEHGERCINLNLTSNVTTYHHKCKDDRRICMVRRARFVLFVFFFFYNQQSNATMRSSYIKICIIISHIHTFHTEHNTT